jgi:hypothetical protein
MIFQSELTNLETELSQLEMMLTAKRQQLGFFQNLQTQADECLEKLSRVVNHAKESTAHGAIASLKTAVLTLFADGDGSNDGGGNQPTDPTPDPDPCSETKEATTNTLFTPGSILVDELESLGIVIGTNNLGMRVDWLGIGSCPNPASGKGIWYDWVKDKQALASLKPAAHDRVKLLTTSEFLQFQDWDSDQLDEYWDGEWVSDYGCQYRWGGATIDRWIVVSLQSCDWASPFASPIACLLWEDSPLLGQHCFVSFSFGDASANEENENKGTKEGEAMPYVELVKVSDAIAYQRKHDGEIICCYVGFRTKAIAQSWLHFFEAVTSAVEVRQAKRLETKWEIKIKGLSLKQVERFKAECDFSKSYRTEVCSSKPPGYTEPHRPQPVNPDEVGEGDIVTALLTPSGSYKIIQIMPNGILDCQNLTTGDRLGLRATAVTLVQKEKAINESALVGAAAETDYDF